MPPPASKAPTLHGTCSGPIPPMGLALLLDGNMVATTQVGMDNDFTFDLPASMLAATLDVIAIPSGLAILPRPIQLDHGIEWLGWSASRGEISGRFRLQAGQAGPPILVQAYAEGRLLLQTFAIPAPLVR